VYSYREYLDYADACYCEAEASKNGKGLVRDSRNLTASILFSSIAIEAFVNDMMADFTALSTDILTINELAFLSEREVEFVDSGEDAGTFRISNSKSYKPLENKIMFLLRRFAKKKICRGQGLLQRLQTIKQLRDKLTHPRKLEEPDFSLADAAEALEVAKEVIGVLARDVWQKKIRL
jgi:hypothetical protein